MPVLLLWFLISALATLSLMLWNANLALSAPGYRAKGYLMLALGAGLAALPIAANALFPIVGLPFKATVFWLGSPLLLGVVLVLAGFRAIPDAKPWPLIAQLACIMLWFALLAITQPL